MRSRHACFLVCSNRSMGSSLLSTTSSLITHSFTFSREGSSYMISSMQDSMMARRPRAPDLRLIASRETAERALSVKRRLTPSISKSFWYCLMSAFFGSLSHPQPLAAGIPADGGVDPSLGGRGGSLAEGQVG